MVYGYFFSEIILLVSSITAMIACEIQLLITGNL